MPFADEMDRSLAAHRMTRIRFDVLPGAAGDLFIFPLDPAALFPKAPVKHSFNSYQHNK